MTGTSTPTPAPTGTTDDVTFSPPVVDFGAASPGQSSNTAVVTLSNSSNNSGPVSLRGWSVGPDFVVVSTTCAAALNPGQSCTYTLAFQPQSTGFKGEAFRVFDAFPLGVEHVRLIGIGIPN